jgi:WhiB family transcriptional regulator, redox-sensing transcriptional regulator
VSGSRQRAAADQHGSDPVSSARTGQPDLAARAAGLRRLKDVPDVLLADLVAEHGLVRQPDGGQPDEVTDRELAARLCAGCPVQDECLELDLRWMADRTVGAFAGLTEADRRAIWAATKRADR